MLPFEINVKTLSYRLKVKSYVPGNLCEADKKFVLLPHKCLKSHINLSELVSRFGLICVLFPINSTTLLATHRLVCFEQVTKGAVSQGFEQLHNTSVILTESIAVTRVMLYRYSCIIIYARTNSSTML